MTTLCRFQLIACFRRTGLNNSVVNRQRMLRENRSIRDQFGPKSELRQRLWRWTLKVRLNLGNPAWMANKMGGLLTNKLGLAR